MASEKYLAVSHFKPEGYPEIYPGMSDEVRQMMPFLVENVSRRWTKIPNYDLETLVTQTDNVPCLAFKKQAKEIYVHIFCNEFMTPIYALQMVVNLYKKFNLGTPAFKMSEKNWIHSIPLPGPGLTEQETLLIHQITQALFWTVFMHYKQYRKP